jgi:hypothetical protein
LIHLLPKQTHLNIDETGHKERGAAYWTWCFRAKAFSAFKIHPSRGSEVLVDVLGQDYSGTLGADFWGAYRKYAQISWARFSTCWRKAISGDDLTGPLLFLYGLDFISFLFLCLRSIDSRCY